MAMDGWMDGWVYTSRYPLVGGAIECMHRLPLWADERVESNAMLNALEDQNITGKMIG
jgi:hypothetical protein